MRPSASIWTKRELNTPHFNLPSLCHQRSFVAWTPFSRRWRAWYIVMGSMLYAISGCTYTRVVLDGWAPLKALADPKPQVSQQVKKVKSTSVIRDQWSIIIESFDGPSRKRQAARLMDQLHDQGHLPDLWIHQSPNQTQIYRGLYDNPNDPRARSDLRQTRLVKLKDQRSFLSARLIPLGPTPHDQVGELDLRPHTGKYSLQISYYDEQFGPKFRQAAEKAAQALRSDGDEAYYYHGPHRSMVTVGLFTDVDFSQKGPIRVYGSRIKALQDKYPYNLGNGLTLIKNVDGKTIGEQSSFLVRVN